MEDLFYIFIQMKILYLPLALFLETPPWKEHKHVENSCNGPVLLIPQFLTQITQV